MRPRTRCSCRTRCFSEEEREEEKIAVVIELAGQLASRYVTLNRLITNGVPGRVYCGFVFEIISRDGTVRYHTVPGSATVPGEYCSATVSSYHTAVYTVAVPIPGYPYPGSATVRTVQHQQYSTCTREKTMKGYPGKVMTLTALTTCIMTCRSTVLQKRECDSGATALE